MIAIELRFPTGKWHATPWGRQVNEGAIEWPPSPWRLLRALLAVWHHKMPDVPDKEMRSLVSALTPLPLYSLPEASQGHTRHYMPVANDNRTKVFDTFVAVPPMAPIVVCWPEVTLDDGQLSLLAELLDRMSYFGRAESWIDARLIDDVPVLDVKPLADDGVSSSEELVRVLAASPVEEYADWRGTMLDQLQDRMRTEKKVIARKRGKPVDKVKLTKSDMAKVNSALPESTFDALHVETSELQSAGWSRPPGSRWVDYVRPRELFAPRVKAVHRARRALSTVARFAIASKVHPRLTEALWIGERARQIVMGCSKRANRGQPSPVFSGKNSSGDPRRNEMEAHSHAHYLCESSAAKERGQITHLTVFAPQGFSRKDEAALSRFQKMWGHGGYDMQLILLGIGEPADFGGLERQKGDSPILAASRTWLSRTPFVPTDHLKIRANEAKDPMKRSSATHRELERILRKELLRRPWLRNSNGAHLCDLLVEVEAILDPKRAGTNLGKQTSWLKFRRERKDGGGRKSSSHGYGFRLTFSEPVRGPIVLGYGCHFGLGQFIPAEDQV